MHEETWKPEELESPFSVINESQINSIKNSLREAFAIDLDAAGVEISIHGPGDSFFDEIEANYRKEMGLPEELEGELPGFVVTIGNDRIAFFTVKESNVMSMANKYAEKEGMAKRFIDTEEAKIFLQELAVKALFHEVTHIAWPEKIDPVLLSSWEEYVAQNEDLRARVVELQKDKYQSEDDIPVAEEALADAMVEVLSFGGIPSRLNMPEVVEYLRRLIDEKNIRPVTLDSEHGGASPADINFNEYGEIVRKGDT